MTREACGKNGRYDARELVLVVWVVGWGRDGRDEREDETVK